MPPSFGPQSALNGASSGSRGEYYAANVAGDFAKVYDEEIWSIHGFIAYRVRSVADAEDLTQCTFERALKSWKRFDPKRAPARVWLLAIARNLLIDHYRAADSRSERSLGRSTRRIWAACRPSPTWGSIRSWPRRLGRFHSATAKSSPCASAGA